MHKSPTLAAAFFGFLALSSPLSSANDGGQLPPPNTEALRYVAEIPECRRYLGQLHTISGLPSQTISAAVAGDREQSERIYLWLLAHGGEHGVNHSVTCPLLYWEDVAAQQGSVYAAYELGVYADQRSPGRCERSKHWAAFGLSRIEEFRKGFVADASREQIERSLAGRRAQFEKALSTPCPKPK